ncbi:MAG: RNA methyltransferase [Dehalococcoidales bacterium]|nr:RNA methyltransferase [Dehalococcoidales bacterium]
MKSLKWYRQLAERKGRLEAGAFTVEGEKAILQIAASRPEAITEIVSLERPPTPLQDYPVRKVTASQFKYIGSTQTPQGIMAVVRIPADTYSSNLPADPGKRILLLEDIQDPGNTGTLIRTAAAFYYDGVILTENGADPLAPKCVQATAGTVLSLWLRRTAQYLTMVQELKEKGYKIIAAEVKGTEEPAILSKQEKLMLALGNEAAGLSRGLLEIADHRVRIPTAPEKAESLNVAACGAIVMYLSSQN